MEILVNEIVDALALKTQNDSLAFIHELKQEMHADLKYVESLEDELDELESDKAEFPTCMICFCKNVCLKMLCVLNLLTSSDLDEITELQCLYLHKVMECDCLAQMAFGTNDFYCLQLILFIVDSGCTKHMTGNVSLLCNFVEKYLGTVRFGNDQFAPILVGQFCDADLEVAFRKSTCFVRDLQGNDLLSGNRGSDLYTISLQETTSSTLICLLAKASPTQAWLWHRRLSHLNFDYINLLSKKDIVIGLPKLKYVKDQLCSSCEVSKAKRSSFKSKTVPSSKGRLNLLHMDLCGPMRVASINGKKYILMNFSMMVTSRVNKSSSPTDNSVPQDTHPSTNIQPTSEPSTPTNAHAEENNVDQAEFTNPFCTPVQEIAESSSRNSGNSNVHTFNQPQNSEYRWTKDHPLTQVRGNPSKPVQTRRQLATDPEMCMFALTVSIVEPKNIKEAMADSAWLHQFDRLQVWELVDKPFGKNVIKLKFGLWNKQKGLKDQTCYSQQQHDFPVAKGIARKAGVIDSR
ncbi:integrase, catalytic region, zinc finger, CCHC-type containing protein [Tanacetum coccineum]